ncbi:MAG TPA: DNA polymerase III subunit gamma/tau [Verrucomicrobiae bacterium]|jgi:DNA polymerase-3 subunit gamma/tau|nr:DNA polymerase III subunit gamma/tau [Verrucomicrobiae bacterium]
MGQALYRTHRPKKLSEVIGQEHITHTLEQALKQERISHAYLLTGPRGVGKTSIARILAHEINGLPYSDDSTHMDIIEIDAASNRRIDEIRELRDKVYVAPTSAKYKVYIIDEVHMLTREAFNALLKTLEEPPAHVVFILATTDAHKLPETIISRTQRFSFKPVDKDKVAAHLKQIAKQEKITIDDEALALLAVHGEGSLRDSIGLLDQAGSHGQAVSADTVRQLLGIPPATAIDELLQDLQQSPSKLITAVSSMHDQGYQAAAVAKQLGQAIRSQLVEGRLSLPADQALQLLARLIEVPAAHDPERFLEISLLQARSANTHQQEEAANSMSAITQPLVAAKPAPKPNEPVEPEAPQAAEPPKTAKAVKSDPPAANKPKSTAHKHTDLNAALWPEILAALKQKHNTLYGIARMAEPAFPEDGGLELRFAFAFHQKQLNEAANRQLFADVVHDLTGQNVMITYVLDKNATAPATKPAATPKPAAAAPDSLQAISSIFGGGEVLDS